MKQKKTLKLKDMRLSKSKKGITLIALVVTIVVILILAAISITALVGENGLITRARLAAEKTNEAIQNDITAMEEFNQQLENILNENSSEITDDKKPMVTVTKVNTTTNSIKVSVKSSDGENEMPENIIPGQLEQR